MPHVLCLFFLLNFTVGYFKRRDHDRESPRSASASLQHHVLTKLVARFKLGQEYAVKR